MACSPTEVKSAEARSGIIQIQPPGVNTFFDFFVARLRLPSPYTSVESGIASPFGHPNENAAEPAAFVEALDGSLPIDQL
ncbi:hypothetical protein ACQVBX_04665 [Dyella sp. KULCS107]|uniref:hypothetical protein n=1 Tax=Dyella sp. KULCS107 TaxID=3422216 RepID=UPI003D6F7D21